jgi:CheY-like chemotaxis protein
MASRRILVVDDSATDLELMTKPLRGDGYEVITASDGWQALQRAVAEHPDCIVLDVVLPGVNGFQLCRELRQRPETRATPIILVSVKDTPLDVRWGIQQGANQYLPKPFTAATLLASVRDLL